jgi:teichuronic acid biosynthesis protein TuaE
MQIGGRHSIGFAGALSPVNHVTWLQKLWLVTVFLLLCGFGFFAIPLGGLNITAGRISLVMFLYLCLLALFMHQGRLDVRIKVGRYLLFFGLWLLWAVMSLFWATFTVNSARHIEGIIVGTAIVLFSLVFLNHEEGTKNVYRLWIFSATVFVGIAIWEVATGMHLSGSREAEWAGIRQTYPSAVFWNPNDFATFLCLALPFMFGMLLLVRSTLTRALVTILLLASFYFIVLNSSRANIIASLIGIGLVLVLPGLRTRFKSITMVLVVGGVLLLVGFTFLSSVSLFHFDLFKTVPQQISSVSPEDPSTAIRIDLVKNGWAFLRESHFLGVGAGGFEYWMTERPLYSAGGIINAHNWWLELLVDYGVLVFGLFLIFYLGLLWNLLWIVRSSRNQTVKIVSLATFISLVEFSVASISSSGLIRNYAVWLLLATALCIINYYRVTEQKKKDDKRPSDEELARVETQ